MAAVGLRRGAAGADDPTTSIPAMKATALGNIRPSGHEQRAGNEEYGPPAGPDRPCEVREPWSTGWIARADGRLPHHQVPAQ
jgi:hypothetical protein